MPQLHSAWLAKCRFEFGKCDYIKTVNDSFKRAP